MAAEVYDATIPGVTACEIESTALVNKQIPIFSFGAFHIGIESVSLQFQRVSMFVPDDSSTTVDGLLSRSQEFPLQSIFRWHRFSNRRQSKPLSRDIVIRTLIC